MMVDELINTVYNHTFSIVADVLDGDEAFLKRYRTYLIDKYKSLFEEFVREESEETVQAIVQSYIDDERRIWTGLGKEEMISILDEDPAFEQLQFLSSVIFEKARTCLRTKEFLHDNKEYGDLMNEIADCLADLKPQNVEAAKELVSESLLDLDYSYGKSSVKSLRLARLF